MKNGRVRGQQRYRCKACGFNFIEGDQRVDDSLIIKKALAIILYSLAKASFGMLGHIFGVSRSLAYRWIRAEAERLPEPEVPGDIWEIEFDEMWHFIGSKKNKIWIIKAVDRRTRRTGQLGWSVVVMLQPFSTSTTRSNT